MAKQNKDTLVVKINVVKEIRRMSRQTGAKTGPHAFGRKKGKKGYQRNSKHRKNYDRDAFSFASLCKCYNQLMPKKKSQQRLVLLDAHAIIHRAYHGMPDFSSSKGEPTGALYGLIAMLLSIIQELKPDYVAACYDLPGKTFRHEAYKEYKKGRKESDEALKIQLQTSRDVCDAFGIPIYDASGFEADDILGTICDQMKGEVDIVIASGDKDTFQLIDDDRVRVYTLRKGIKDIVLYNEDAVNERFGFGPAQIIDFKALSGDSSDNIVGVKGIGEKTATKLIQAYGTIEEIYKALDADKEALMKKADVKERVTRLLEDGRDDAAFSKVIATIRHDAPVTYELPETRWEEAIDLAQVQEMCSRYEFRTLWNRIQKLYGESEEEKQEKTQSVLFEVPKPEEVREVGVMLWLTNSDITHPSLEDIYMQAGESNLPAARAKILKDLEAKGLVDIFERLEKPLIPIVKQMHEQGVILDVDFLKKLSKKHHKTLDEIESRIFKHAGTEFNTRSPKQLGEILFEKLELPTKGIKKTSTGQLSTRESELEKLKDEHPIIQDLLDYRELHKLLSTYIDALPALVDQESRLHSELLQDGTSTGRFSSREPNLQNIPIRSEMGREIRNAFVAPEGFLLFACDYSQIELRIAAMMTGDEYLSQVFIDGGDIHAAVAARVFDVPVEEVTGNMRRQAKVINFGILYGMGVNALQKNLGSTRAEAQNFYNAYFERLPSIREYLDETKIVAHNQGYTETLFGRRRYFQGLESHLPHIRAMAERMAINAPIQGTAADIIKLSMIHVDQWIRENKLEKKVKMVLQIHDELIFELDKKNADAYAAEIKTIMESVLDNTWIDFKTSVPLRVEGALGTSWGEMKE